MDDSERSQELLDSVDISQLRTDVVKLSSAEPTIKVDVDGEPPPELMNSQYINIHRVPETLGKTLVDCGSPAQQALISGELIGHHIVHGGMVVDMMVPPPVTTADFTQHTALDRATLPQYIPEHYDAEDDILSHELTEEDRRLAAALVAVQIVQQEKQQQHPSVVSSEANVIVSPNGLPGLITSSGHLSGKVQVPVSISDHHMTTMSPMSPSAGVPEEKQGMAAMVSSYIQAVEEEAVVGVGHLDQQGDRILKMYQPGPPAPQAQELRLPPLPPLKKVLSSQSMAVRSRYVRPHAVNVHDPSDVGLGEPRLTPPEQQSQTLDGSSVRVGEASRLPEPDELLKEEFDVKSEGIDDELGEESDDMPQDDNDSDYDVENDLRPSRKSLPHKKRIPRKLKNPKKSSPSRSGEKSYNTKFWKCTKCGEQFISQSLLASHKLTHVSGKRMFNCELCGKGFANQLKFFEHLKSHYEPSVGSVVSEQSGSKNLSVKDKIIPKEEVGLKQEVDKQIVECQDSMVALPPPLVCNQCGKTFRRQKAFESHVNLAHPKQEEIEEFSEPEDLMEGIQVSVDGADGDTDDGDMDCLTSSSIVRGLKNNNDKDWYREEDLHAAEADIQEMEQQQQQQQQHQHTAEHDNVCELCGELFEDKGQFDQHLREEHLEFIDPSVKDFHPDPDVKDDAVNPVKRRVIGKKSRRSGVHLTCPQCGRMFNHRNSLVYHLRSHSGERPHQCEVCGKSFFAASALKVHMRLHSGDKPYKCEFCGRYFRQYGDLKYHCTSIHSEEKNYQCEYCGKDFARKYSLIVHRRIHTGEKNYKCEFCGKSFRASSYLQNHRRIHTGEKPHPCEVCGKPFRVRSDMKRHLNTHNRDRHRSNGSTVNTATNGGNSNSNSNSGMSECPSLRAMLQDTGKLKAEPDEEQMDPSSLQPTHTISVDQPMTEMSVADISMQNGGPESILPDEALGEQQPINLNIAVPAPPGTPRQATTHHQLTAAQAVPEEVLHYSRDPLESVRDGNNTLYVWPIYMA
ncbi:hypothetical protein R5R35_007655 [Gryllus longicercus]|uniref:C2H2-type domain-containing protein n=1 Tax=Gryllus longicercus TaxID=2509291 RepID=A0AAN9VFW8_9ORTH|nr:Krueppel homolog 1 [Gryllus bimaculatus]